MPLAVVPKELHKLDNNCKLLQICMQSCHVAPRKYQETSTQYMCLVNATVVVASWPDDMHTCAPVLEPDASDEGDR